MISLEVNHEHKTGKTEYLQLLQSNQLQQGLDFCDKFLCFFQVSLNIISFYCDEMTIITFQSIVKHSRIELTHIYRHNTLLDKMPIEKSDNTAVFAAGQIPCQQ